MPRSHGASQTATLAAAVATNFDFAVHDFRRVQIVITNDGATNAIGTTAVSVSPGGTNFGTLAVIGTAVGSIAASTSSKLIDMPVSATTLRVALTSADGSTATVEVRGTEEPSDGVIRVGGNVVGDADAGALSTTTLAVSGAAALASTLAVTGATTLTGALTCNGAVTVQAADAGAAAASGTVNARAGTFTVASGQTGYVLTNNKIATTSLLFVTCISGAVAQQVISFIPTLNTGTLLLSGAAGANAKFAFLVVTPGA